MRNLKAFCLCFIFSTICLAATPPTENDDAARIIQAALQPSPIESNLRHLTDEIGGRVPGTPAMQRAVEWGVKMFKAAGADSVHTETFTIPHSWAEGATEMSVSATGTALDPNLTQIPKIEFRVRCVSIAWAPALAPVKTCAGRRCGQRQFRRIQEGRRYFRENRTRPFRCAEDLGRPLRRIYERASRDHRCPERQGEEL
jgi:hypothetical protein